MRRARPAVRSSADAAEAARSRLRALVAAAWLVATPLTTSAQSPLSFERYRTEVEPIFVAPRGGHGPGLSPCVTCHVHSGTPLELEPLEEASGGEVYWTEEQSRRNFEVVARLVVPGRPDQSRLLRKALSADAGGAEFHVGGSFFASREDPEWRRISQWIGDADSYPAFLAPAAEAPSVDFEFFQTCVQRIFLDKRPGRVECVHCHGSGVRGFASTLPEGRAYWDEEEARRNFAILRRYIDPGHPERSRFLMHPLAPAAGGDPYHGGGRRWPSKDDPEWRMLATWVRGERVACVLD